jgi:hypothetical protein
VRETGRTLWSRERKILSGTEIKTQQPGQPNRQRLNELEKDPWHGDQKAGEIDSQRKNLSGELGHDRNRARKKQLTEGKRKFPERGTKSKSKTK